jgi:hypothetical protein
MPATLPLRTDKVEIQRMVEEVSYAVMLKASLGAVGKGMQVIESAYELDEEGILEGENLQQRLIMMKSIWKSQSAGRVTQKFSYWVIAVVTLCIYSSVIDQSNAATKKLLSARQPRI